MKDIRIFSSPEFGEIRTIEVNGEPWLVGKDVAQVLGYSDTDQALRKHVDEEDKLTRQFNGSGQNRAMTIINESGLYALVLSSKLPTAKKFRRWVTAEVLPSIRRHGAYMTPETIEKILTDPDTIIQLATELKEEREKRKALETRVKRDRPKVLFADSVAASKTSILVGELAKLLKQNGVEMGQIRMFQWLRDQGYLIRRQGTDFNMPTQRAMELGLFEIKETAVAHSDGHTTITKTPKVTGKGQAYFVNKFLGEGR